MKTENSMCFAAIGRLLTSLIEEIRKDEKIKFQDLARSLHISNNTLAQLKLGYGFNVFRMVCVCYFFCDYYVKHKTPEEFYEISCRFTEALKEDLFNNLHFVVKKNAENQKKRKCMCEKKEG